MFKNTIFRRMTALVLTLALAAAAALPGLAVYPMPIQTASETEAVYLFNADTGKTIIRTENEIRFSQIGETLTPYQLSSGEKQMLVILLTVLVEDQRPYVLFMDEPEVSLHVDWQQRLIDLILELNPNVQIILTTHSPAVIMNGWADRVTEVSDITDNQ